MFEWIKKALTKKVNLDNRQKEYQNQTYILLNAMKYFSLGGTFVSTWILFLAFGGFDNFWEAAGKALLLDVSIFFFMQMLLRSSGTTRVMIILGFAFVTLLSIYQAMEYQIAKKFTMDVNQIDMQTILRVDRYQWFSSFRQGGFVQVILFFLGIGQLAFINNLERKEVEAQEKAAQRVRNAEAYARIRAQQVAQGIPLRKRGRPRKVIEPAMA
jgi:hypothetical protein